MKAAIALPENKGAEIAEVALPKVRDEWVLVRVKAVAANPADWKYLYNWPGNITGTRAGSDYAGIVEEIGDKITKFKKGDRIAGLAHGCNRLNPESGAFGEYIIAKELCQIRIPDNISFEQASTIGVSFITCGQGLYKALKLPLPSSPATEPFPVLIHGGSTTTGMWGIQFAKASGLTVITTASPHNFDRLKSLGADAVFDYRSPTCGADIRRLTKNKLRHAWACVDSGEEICAAALSDSEPSKFGFITQADNDLLQRTNPLIKEVLFTVGYDGIAEPYEWAGELVLPRQDEKEFATMFYELARDLLERGVVKPIDITVNKTGSGLDGVLKGVDELRTGRVSGTKLVYTI